MNVKRTEKKRRRKVRVSGLVDIWQVAEMTSHTLPDFLAYGLYTLTFYGFWLLIHVTGTSYFFSEVLNVYYYITQSFLIS